ARPPSATRAAGTATSEAVEIDSALTPQGFDAEKLGAMIADAKLSPQRKAELAALLDQAARNPAARAAALARIKASLP
ncbi:hypothetical protein DIE28_11870, partial [Paracoccus thiocyanatus]